MAFVRVAHAEELPPGGRLAAEAAGEPIALFNIEGRVFAIEDRCPHQMAPLNDGHLAGTRLTCRWHGWSFDLDPRKPGEPSEFWPGMPRVRRYGVKIDAGEIYVDVTPATPGRSAGRSTQ